MIAFIDSHKDREVDGRKWGIESICTTLQFAPSTYYAARSRPPSQRSLRDEELKVLIQAVHDSNYGVYGAEKVWEQLLRDGVVVARCTVERLMGDLGIEGARRGRSFVVTTEADPLAERPKDFVERNFTAIAPRRLWVADITYVRTLVGWVYVAFVIDVFSRRIVGWKVSTSLHTGLALDALEMALHANESNGDLVHHSDRGSQYLSIKYSDRLADVGVTASVGTKGDSYDNALAESFNGLYKWELIYRRDAWRNIDHVEWETLLYVDWFNNRRLHGANGMVPPVELEAAYYALINNPAEMLISQ